jgi:NDP-sugar pyrophosphorylase family protein
MKKSTEKVQKIVEKPKIFVGNKINTGISLLNPSVLAKMHSFFFFFVNYAISILGFVPDPF